MEAQSAKTAIELVRRVRQILRPRMSELARILDVPRQEIYRWAAGQTLSSGKRPNLLQSMADAADVFESAGISKADHLISIQISEGRTLLDLIEVGENTERHLALLIEEHRIQRAAYEASGLKNTRAPATDDWRAAYSIPDGF